MAARENCSSPARQREKLICSLFLSRSLFPFPLYFLPLTPLFPRGRQIWQMLWLLPAFPSSVLCVLGRWCGCNCTEAWAPGGWSTCKVGAWYVEWCPSKCVGCCSSACATGFHGEMVADTGLIPGWSSQCWTFYTLSMAGSGSWCRLRW